MRGIWLSALLLLGGCGAGDNATPEASEKSAIDRSVADVAAAEAAAATPLPTGSSETGKAGR